MGKLIMNGKEITKPFMYNGKKVVKIIMNGKVLTLRDTVSYVNTFTGTFMTPAKEAEFLAVTTEVDDYAFSAEFGLTSIKMPGVQTVGIHSFEDSALTTIDLPECITIKDRAFGPGDDITLITPKLQTIGDYAFGKANTFIKLDLPSVVTIGTFAFQNVISIGETLTLPKLKEVKDLAFSAVGSLKTLDLPECTSIGVNAFSSSPLTSLSIPKAATIGDGSFQLIVNAPTTTVTMKSKYNTVAWKDRIFTRFGEPSGSGWDQITFTWVP